MRRGNSGAGGGARVRPRAYTASQAHGGAMQATARQDTRMRRFVRRVMQRVAIVIALLVLFYATSLHGINSRTFILAGALALFLYWVFKGWL